MKIAVYRAVTGNYERIQDSPAPSGADCFLFTDSKVESANGWTSVHSDQRCKNDSIRSARAIKILGNELLNEYDFTIWVDNRVELKASATEIVGRFLTGETELAVPVHSYHHTLETEFQQVLAGSFDEPRRVREQRNLYQEIDPAALKAPVYWSAILIRRNTQSVSNFSRQWWEQVLRYSRRDQLSLPFALSESQIRFNAFPLDNHQSDIHTWRNEDGIGRNFGVAHWAPHSYRTELKDLLTFAKRDLRRTGGGSK